MGVPGLKEGLLEKLHRSGFIFLFLCLDWLDLLGDVTNTVLLCMSLSIPV